MKQVNNYLKKASLVFVSLMFVAIPNLQMYSSIGSYQIGSTAITANKKYQPIKINNANNIADVVAFPAALPCEVVQAFLHSQARAQGRYYYGDGCSSSKPIDKNYAKYDFSGFDN